MERGDWAARTNDVEAQLVRDRSYHPYNIDGRALRHERPRERAVEAHVDRKRENAE